MVERTSLVQVAFLIFDLRQNVRRASPKSRGGQSHHFGCERLLPLNTQLQTCRCAAPSDAMCQNRKSAKCHFLILVEQKRKTASRRSLRV
jgi:hypothetical protein